MWQELRSGARVRARGEHWRVLDVIDWTDCREVRLIGLEASNHAVERTLLAPFDRFEPAAARRPSRSVGRRRWMRALREAVGRTFALHALRAAHRATVTLLPYQIEPCLALLRGDASRVLLADEVGLGKTIQALVALAELGARGDGSRVLILTPAGLRDQWAGELAERFSIRTTVADAAALAEAALTLPPNVNPWTLPGVHIVSLDFVKRPEVVRALESLWWDLLIVDEAHLAAPGTHRHIAVAGLARRAARVMLLTATPHAGDDEAYASLCAIGALDEDAEDRLLVFRRSRAALGSDTRPRRMTLVSIRATADERRMHHLLDRYTARVWREAGARGDHDARLAMMVLRKRALSSAWALARSIERRLASLEGAAAAEQPELPFLDDPADETPDDREPDALVAAPGLSNRHEERQLLAEVLEAASAAERHESKLAALARLLRRTREPAIVFTEYRDTLCHLAAGLEAIRPCVLLHGGQSRDERADAAGRFNQGTATLLLATDAAGEGLNLQRRCRWVINQELPWNPMRLEQRAGRVDRIGQTRRPHALHLVAPETAEADVLARLAWRVSCARRAVGVPDALQRLTEGRVAAAVMRREPLEIAATSTDEPEGADEPNDTHEPKGSYYTDEPKGSCHRQPWDIGAAAVEACADAELRRAALTRRTARGHQPPGRTDDRPLLTVISPGRRARGRAELDRLLGAGRRLSVMRLELRDGLDRTVVSTLVGILFGDAAPLDGTDASAESAADLAEQHARALLARLSASQERAVARALARERAMSAACRAALARPLIQPALFDRRALDDAGAAREAARRLQAEGARRLHRLEAALGLTTAPPELLLAAGLRSAQAATERSAR